jgi:hypothetical protein
MFASTMHISYSPSARTFAARRPASPRGRKAVFVVVLRNKNQHHIVPPPKKKRDSRGSNAPGQVTEFSPFEPGTWNFLEEASGRTGVEPHYYHHTPKGRNPFWFCFLGTEEGSGEGLGRVTLSSPDKE